MGILERIFGGGAQKSAPATDDMVARAIVERVVDATDKRLKLVSGYERALHDAALVTFDHLRRLVLAIPGPVDASAASWAADPALRPFFARAQDAPVAFSRSREVRAFFADSGAPDCIAPIGFEHIERQVFARIQRGDGVQCEVARTTVCFERPRLMVPGNELRAVRIDIGKRGIDYLALRALAAITAVQERKRELEEERALLRMRYDLAVRGGHGLSGLSSAGTAPTADPAALKQELAANQRSLAAHAATGLMAKFVDIVRGVLADPGAHLRFATTPMTLDAMNFKVADGEPGGTRIAVQDLWIDDRGPFAMMLARFPRSELLPERDLVADAERFL